MRSRILVGALALLASLVVGSAVTGSAADPVMKWAIVNLTETMSIAGSFVSGPVMFVHDDAKMAKGAPSMRVYRFVPGKGLAEEIVSFHCKPRWGTAPGRFTTATNREAHGPRAHGVPVRR